MPAVHLDFIPPEDPNITKLHIYEAPAKDGPFNVIETVVGVGSFPDYLSEYTTTQALSLSDWFSIRWENDKGALSPFSSSIQGQTITLVARIKQRVLERDATITERLAVQEAEAAIQQFYGPNVDPYDPTLTWNYRTLNGLAYLTLARVGMFRLVTGGSNKSFTVGLVSVKSGTTVGSSREGIDGLIKLAYKDLGIPLSYVMLMEELNTRIPSLSSYDHSRLVGTLTFE